MKHITVVGSGLYGLTVARLAAEDGINVRIIEKRSHIGGNSYSRVDSQTNVDVHLYGSHLFHTNNVHVWKFITSFGEFNGYKHFVVANSDGEFFSVPPNVATYQKLYPEARTIDDLWVAVEQDSKPTQSERGLEAKAVEQMGRRAYQRLVAGYTQKQWQVPAAELPPETIARLPSRRNHQPWYFNDHYQGVPIRGYGHLAEKLADHPRIVVETETDFHKMRVTSEVEELVVYTGAIDALVNYKFGVLGWRTVDFEFQNLDQNDFQGAAVVNYPSLEVPYTRVHEFKHLHPEASSKHVGTTIAYEFSRIAGKADEPYYPINSAKDKVLLTRYREEIRTTLPHFHLGGRLATYRYLDMHMAIGAALKDWEQDLRPRILSS